MKSFDFFRKLSYNDIKHQTLLGGLLSICAIILISFLLITEINSFRTPLIIKNSFIKQFPSNQEIPVRFSLQTFFCPCAIISVDQEDLIGNHEMNLDETQITKIQIDSKNQVINSKLYSPHKTDKLTESLLKNETCYIGGKISIKRVPGDFHISFHEYRSVFELFVNDETLNKQFLGQLRLDHELVSLMFMDEETNKKILNKFGMNEYTKGFMQKNVIAVNRYEHGKFNYDYYLKIIPYIFVDEYTGETIDTYEYSLSYSSRENDEESNEMPIIMFNYDFSPITMEVRLVKKSLSRFLTHVCAIVGGVYVVFSMMNRFFVNGIC